MLFFLYKHGSPPVILSVTRLIFHFFKAGDLLKYWIDFDETSIKLSRILRTMFAFVHWRKTIFLFCSYSLITIMWYLCDEQNVPEYSHTFSNVAEFYLNSIDVWRVPDDKSTDKCFDRKQRWLYHSWISELQDSTSNPLVSETRFKSRFFISRGNLFDKNKYISFGRINVIIRMIEID